MIKRLILKAIRRYQATGGSKKHFNLTCNFEPTCSEYTYQAIDKYGVIKGMKMGWTRIKRCDDPDCTEIKKDPLR
ncbi:membrane protein insertion efficiency factor YidD [Catenovulum sp. SM1970]|uniref:membrane protein insertion efficiency factor YidD n=1 Tax=Marinifaba aquimaris TaxID=2741323 RepID=UPI001571B50A|nr:membrane protein insertion efficiency factor YidD [Marinifaba aquimaris]NTS77636.1 membrane protein insertion efficiency factor YidD [Marinifaba aquimaris]